MDGDRDEDLVGREDGWRSRDESGLVLVGVGPRSMGSRRD